MPSGFSTQSTASSPSRHQGVDAVEVRIVARPEVDIFVDAVDLGEGILALGGDGGCGCHPQDDDAVGIDDAREQRAGARFGVAVADGGLHADGGGIGLDGGRGDGDARRARFPREGDVELARSGRGRPRGRGRRT